MAILGQNFEGIMDGADRAMFDKNFDRSGAMLFRAVGGSTTAADRWCIAVIDESSLDHPIMENHYATLRSTWPDRKIFVLVPGAGLVGPTLVTSPSGEQWDNTDSTSGGYGGATDDIFIPQQAVSDRAANLFIGPIRVNRDAGIVGNRSDWFALTGLSVLPAGAKVGLFVDNSGSMSTATVQASYNKFLADIAAAGLSIITVTDSSEDWAVPFTGMSGV